MVKPLRQQIAEKVAAMPPPPPMHPDDADLSAAVRALADQMDADIAAGIPPLWVLSGAIAERQEREENN